MKGAAGYFLIGEGNSTSSHRVGGYYANSNQIRTERSRNGPGKGYPTRLATVYPLLKKNVRFR